MADITLAEFDGQVWLIAGEDYLDGLLSNRLPEGKTIEIIPCAMRSDVHEMWLQNSPEAEADEANGISGMPWQIHPNIVARIKRAALGFVVQFSAWSALLDKDAERVIASAVAELREKPDVEVVVVCYDEPGTSAAVAAISDVRMQMVADRLITEQVAESRIRRERRDKSKATEGSTENRVDIMVGSP